MSAVTELRPVGRRGENFLAISLDFCAGMAWYDCKGHREINILHTKFLVFISFNVHVICLSL